ncbi:protein adenylyltransferase SelO [Pseudoroseicyclus aestuarii]|uniref:Protein nucleotidyltransferase YdiU n=1 Tax=Pseudoroseicyclus aestuarii TaxID=1795041 RepID=A0A318SNR8_9RHOB|nr:YdiU family protein [Pseudoroseicyclus aestuarii]PYE81225.1 uncharacterized protein YdiU (UPF0061 family) [Pseudoroseicyclus aestuarii]
MTLHIPFDNSYARLPARLFTHLDPTPVAAPAVIAVNDALARLLTLDPVALRGAEGAAVLAGNRVPEGAQPLAQLYAGHQFGNWNPQLGDGRAILLGEVIGTDGIRRDIQLKGAGPTPYSRMGDGRAWLGPVLREYLMSEAMHALGVPTTRALAATLTGESVMRETALPGAVLTRVAQSHIRVGTFQVLMARDDVEGLRALEAHARARHYPGTEGPEGLLEGVTARQAELVAQWMSLGFIHGVMNTDNCQIAGETIDYGPCAFMDSYHPARVFSSIDAGGRYAYGNQPQIALWNLAQLATALLPLEADQDQAAERYTEVINRFAPIFQAAWLRRFGAKLGLAEPQEDDRALIEALLTMMAQQEADFTGTFRALAEGRDPALGPDFAGWQARWQARHPDEGLMRASNPAIVPRLHRIEAAIEAARGGDLAPFHALLAAATDPYAPAGSGERAALAAPPSAAELVDRTFCGT